jgi:hypothetical protein
MAHVIRGIISNGWLSSYLISVLSKLLLIVNIHWNITDFIPIPFHSKEKEMMMKKKKKKNFCFHIGSLSFYISVFIFMKKESPISLFIIFIYLK